MNQTDIRNGIPGSSTTFLYQVPVKKKTNYAAFFKSRDSFSSHQTCLSKSLMTLVLAVHMWVLQQKYEQHFYRDDAVKNQKMSGIFKNRVAWEN